MIESQLSALERQPSPDPSQQHKLPEIRLVFSEGPNFELLQTWFTHPLLPNPLKCNRGKIADSKGDGTFGWTNSVKAICSLCVRHKLRAFGTSNISPDAHSTTAGCISGTKGSLAASLGYALAKEPLWLQEMFGVDSKGAPILKRILNRTNPELKRPGPTQISINHAVVGPHSIRVYLGPQLVEEEAALQVLLLALERSADKSSTPVQRSDSTFLVRRPSSDSLSQPNRLGIILPVEDCHNTVKDRFISEALWALRTPEIFSRHGYQGALKKLSLDPSFLHVCSSVEGLNSVSERSLPTNVLQGLLTRGLKEYCQRRGMPIQIGITPAQVASISILTQMQREGLDLEIDYGFSLSEDLLGVTKDEEGPLDGFVVTIASAAVLMASKDSTYAPLSLMPRISHAVVRKTDRSLTSSRNLAGRFLMVSDAPSTPQFCLDSLIRRGLAARKEVNMQFANPSDVTRKMIREDSDEMTILGFPHYSLLDLVDGLSLADGLSRDDMSQGAVLFVRRSLAKDERFALALLGYLRGSWLSLSHNTQALSNTIQSVLQNEQYTRSLGLTIGAHHFLGADYATRLS
jgi:hypothetical protein